MSLEALKAFTDRMKNDEAFRNRIGAVADVEGRVRLARAEGFDITEEECKLQAQKLSEEEVNAVSGGGDVTQCDASSTYQTGGFGP